MANVTVKYWKRKWINYYATLITETPMGMLTIEKKLSFISYHLLRLTKGEQILKEMASTSELIYRFYR